MSTVIVAIFPEGMAGQVSSSLAKHERHILMMFFHNLRTLIGIPIEYGWQVRSEKLYRSDSIACPRA